MNNGLLLGILDRVLGNASGVGRRYLEESRWRIIAHICSTELAPECDNDFR